jgi:hypothetical protein
MGLLNTKRAYLFLGMFLAGLSASAQDSLMADWQYISKNDAWLLTHNPNAIQNISAPKISVAEVFIEKNNGGFINYFESNNSIQYGLRTESFYKLNPKIAFYGKVEYCNFKGKNMGGSAFINPYLASFDIQELSDLTSGNKQLETYLLDGAVSFQATNKLAIATKISYESANYTKLKDLRHANKLLNMNANIGLTYQLSPKTQLGLNYDYDRRIESLGFKIYGNTDTQYLSLISFGAFWGRTELHTESGYTAENTSYDSPMANSQHRVHAQVNIKLSDQINWLTEIGMGINKGHYGKKGTNSITYTQHEGNRYEFNSILAVKRENSLHHFQINGSAVSLQNNENVFQRETTTGGVTSIVYYGKNQVLDQTVNTLNLSYTAYLKIKNNVPAWTVNGNVGIFQRDQTATLYPYYRKADLQYISASTSIARNIHKGPYLWTIGLVAGYQQGNGNPFTDHQYTSNSQGKPTSRDLYAQKEFEYFTNAQIFIQPQIKLSFPIQPKIIGYTSFNVQPTKAFQTDFLKSNYLQTQLTLGCQF